MDSRRATLARAFIGFALCLPALLGQSSHQMDNCGSNPPRRPSPDPMHIVGGNPPLPRLWSVLGIPAKLRIPSETGFVTGTEEITCAEGCEAQWVTGDHLLPEDGDDALVRVCADFGTTCRFLLLHDNGAEWQLFDYVDSPYEKYEPPTARVEATLDQRWLVKRGFGGGGSGVYLSVDDWYEVRCGALTPVLTVPAKGRDVNAQPERFFSTRFRGLRQHENHQILEFSYVVLFIDRRTERKLWQEERMVAFSRSDRGTQFVFDPQASDISEEFMDKVFAFDSMDQNEFIAFAYDRLLAIARNPADLRRDLLRSFLSEADQSDKVLTLESLLSGKRAK